MMDTNTDFWNNFEIDKPKTYSEHMLGVYMGLNRKDRIQDGVHFIEFDWYDEEFKKEAPDSEDFIIRDLKRLGFVK